MSDQDTPWPAWVYGTGSEPDYRFSFANERTFLAWIRTALALVAGGVALDALDYGAALPVVLLVLGGLCALVGWVRWASAERAVRRREPLPASTPTAVLATGVLVVALVAVAALLLGRA
jgi:putative membrane protein